MEYLDVYLYDRKVGVLSSDNGRMEFRYVPVYLEQGKNEALSFSLPLRSEPYPEEAIIPFFANLLPDESVRVRIAEILQVSPDNIFGLLKEIGEDCAGAVAFYSQDKSPQAVQEPLYRKLSEDEADNVLTHLSERPLNIGAQDFHISGAGAQDKLVASVERGQVLLPLRGTPSTHIIKPGIARFPESVFNEFYCMKLAKYCGISTAECDILKIKGNAYYSVERYDRLKVDGNWHRLHQEDFCQLLGIDPKIKYESEGGPKLVQCFELLRRMELPAAETIRFLQQIIFCFLIGNGDAHAKNFSVIYRNGRPELAPAYDLLSTAVYPNLAPKLAMKIDTEYNFRWITPGKFIRAGQKAGVSEKVVREQIREMLAKMPKALKKINAKDVVKYPAEVYEKIESGIEVRMKQLCE
jgi:serine/threonine-protein kinase HipA